MSLSGKNVNTGVADKLLRKISKPKNDKVSGSFWVLHGAIKWTGHRITLLMLSHNSTTRCR